MRIGSVRKAPRRALQLTHAPAWAVAVSAAISLLVSPPPVVADAAADAFRAGKAALARGSYVDARNFLLRAVELEPKSSRYEKVLWEANEGILRESARLAPSLGVDELRRLEELQRLCRSISPGDSRAQVVDAEYQKRIRVAERVVAEAIELARDGSLDEPRAVLSRFESVEDLLPAVADLKREIEFRNELIISRDGRSGGDLAAAIVAAREANRIRPGDDEARRELEAVVQEFASRAGPYFERELAGGQLGQIGLAIYSIGRLEETCPECAGRFADAEQLRNRYSKGIRPLLEQLAQETSRASAWARCSLAAEADFILGRGEFANEYCARASVQQPLIGVVVRGTGGCSLDGLEAELTELLPAGSSVVPISTGPEAGAKRGLDLLVGVEITQCVEQDLGERDVQPERSTYLSGSERLPNPQYQSIQDQLRYAMARAQSQRANANANPQDFAAQLAAIAADAQVTNLQRQLQATKPFVTRETEASYSFESFRVGRALAATGHLDLGHSTKAVAARIPLRATEERWIKSARGVHPRDAQGYSNRPISPPASEDLLPGLEEKLREQVKDRVSSALPLLLASRASELLTAGRNGEALGYIALLRTTSIAQDEKDLLAFKTGDLRDFSTIVADVNSVSGGLASFSTRFSEMYVAHASSENHFPGAAPTALESTLEGVVTVRTQRAQGSGFLVSPDGLVITNHHVIAGGGPVRVDTKSRGAFAARVIRQDESSDLALLQIEGRGLPFLPLATNKSARPGADVYAIGSPLGLTGTVTKGIISAVRPTSSVTYLQIDAPINEGNSGGPLVLMNGRVVGINTWKIGKQEGLNFAIAIDEIYRRLGLTPGS